MAGDPYRYFRIEARELLEQLSAGVLALEGAQDGAAPADAAGVARLLRLAHTLKGAARVVRQAEIADLTHGVEDLLAPLREGGAALARGAADQLLAALDRIGALLERLPRPDAAPAPGAAAAAPAVPDTLPQAPPRLARADLVEVDALLEGLGEIGGELEGMRRLAGQLDAATRSTASLAPGLARQRLAQMERALADGIERIDRELRQARDAAERLRLVPAASMCGVLERAARDAAQGLGKQVAFEAAAGSLRLEGDVLELVLGSLVQLVRNAVAHGIETPAERRAAGKQPAGRIAFAAGRRGTRAWFRCSDDGRGVDLAAVRAALARRGAPAGELDGLDAGQLLARLFEGGISTRGAVSELAGRGVGLDVVRDAMARLGGTVHASSGAGGTMVELQVPMSLAALDVLMVEAEGRLLALPLDAVRGTVRVAQDQVLAAADGAAIEYGGQVLAFRPLELGLGTARAGHGRRAMSAVALAPAQGAASAVGVTRLAGVESVVLQPPPPLAAAEASVLGLYLDDAGDPGIVLDPEHLAPALAARANAGAGAGAPAKPILVVDDSLTTRMLECSILEAAGYSVAMAASAEEGLAMALQRDFGLVLVDVEMPGMDGFTFIEKASADPALRHLPCILVTSRDSPQDRARAVQAGARGHIVKGEFDQAQFLRQVGELVQP
ncbi:MAG: hybrid sensor histidine kinase/response regulator [Pseudoduganella sp.]|nr:hybrid sensor histidine kinase/response regulator [Pseudoduganella sp.]